MTTEIIAQTPRALRAEAARLRAKHAPNMPVSQTSLFRAEQLEREAERLEFYGGLDNFLAVAYPDLGCESLGELEPPAPRIQVKRDPDGGYSIIRDGYHWGNYPTFGEASKWSKVALKQLEAAG